jgi:hypothetical protein
MDEQHTFSIYAAFSLLKKKTSHRVVRGGMLLPNFKIHVSTFPKNITMQINKKNVPFKATKQAPFLEEAQMLELLHKVSKIYIYIFFQYWGLNSEPTVVIL